MTTTYLTTQEAADVLGVHQSRIRQFRLDDLLPRSKRFGQVWMIHPGDLERLRDRPGRGRPRKNSRKK